MKKLCLLAICYFAQNHLIALPFDNPAKPIFFNASFDNEQDSSCCDQLFSNECFGFNVGYYGDFVFNRYLETSTERDIDYSQISTNAIYFAMTILDYAEIFTTLGASHFSFNTSLRPFNAENPSPKFNYESASVFSWSVGARSTLLQYNGFALGIMAQYFSANPYAKVLFVRTNVDAHPGPDSKRNYSEWQLGAGLSYDFNAFFIPYAAIKYSQVSWEFNNQTFLVTNTLATIPDLQSSKPFGYAIGLSFIPLTSYPFVATIEGRFVDEAALYFNVFAHF